MRPRAARSRRPAPAASPRRRLLLLLLSWTRLRWRRASRMSSGMLKAAEGAGAALPLPCGGREAPYQCVYIYTAVSNSNHPNTKMKSKQDNITNESGIALCVFCFALLGSPPAGLVLKKALRPRSLLVGVFGSMKHHRRSSSIIARANSSSLSLSMKKGRGDNAQRCLHSAAY